MRTIVPVNLLAVPARLNGRSFLLVVGTGEPRTSLHPDVVQLLRLSPAPQPPDQTPLLFRVDLAKLDPFTRRDLEVVEDATVRDIGADGVLGMDWLSGARRVCLDLDMAALELEDP